MDEVLTICPAPCCFGCDDRRNVLAELLSSVTVISSDRTLLSTTIQIYAVQLLEAQQLETSAADKLPQDRIAGNGIREDRHEQLQKLEQFISARPTRVGARHLQ